MKNQHGEASRQEVEGDQDRAALAAPETEV